MAHVTDSVVGINTKSTAATVTYQKKDTFESAIEDMKITTANKVKMDSAQANKSSSQGADIFTDTNPSFQPRAERKREASQNDSPMDNKKSDPENSLKVDKVESQYMFLKFLYNKEKISVILFYMKFTLVLKSQADGFKKQEKEYTRKEPSTPVRKDTSSKKKDVSSPGTG